VATVATVNRDRVRTDVVGMVSGVRLGELADKSILLKGMRDTYEIWNAAWNAAKLLGTRTHEEVSLLQNGTVVVYENQTKYKNV
jgi:hypothetical protein